MDKPSTLWRTVTSCVLCGSERFSEHIQADDPHYGNKGVFTFVRCEGCGLLFLNPMPTQAYLDHAYPDTYYAYDPPKQASKSQRALRIVKDIVRPILLFKRQTTRDPHFSKPGLMLDVGCGAGEFMWAM